MTLRISDCRKAVGRYYGIKRVVMLGRTQTWKIAHPRQLAMTLARDLTGKSLPDISYHLGKRDHTTVLSGIKAVRKRCAASEGERLTYESLKLTLAVYAAQNAAWREEAVT